MIGLIKGTARQLKTVSGLPLPIASYKSNSKLPIKAIGLPFSCTQSGSGDPYPAGGGKNKFNDTVGTHTINANTATTLQIGTVYLEANTTYTISCKQTPAPLTSFLRNILIVIGGGTTTYNSAGNDYTIKPMTFTPTVSDTYSVMVWGHTLSADTTYSEFQVEKGSQATDYAPYSNIRPITGVSSVNVVRCGKNLFDPIVYSSFLQPDGKYRGSSSSINSIQTYLGAYIGKQMTFSVYVDLTVSPSPTTVKVMANINGTTINGNAISSGDEGYTSVTFIPQSENDYIRITYGSGGNYQFTFCDIQLEFGSTASAYSAYTGNTYTIDLDGTRYGGRIDIVDGEAVMTVTHGFKDLGTLTWANNVTGIFSTQITDLSTANKQKVKCSWYGYGVTQFNWSDVPTYADKTINTATNNYIYIKDTDYSDAPSFKTAVNGVQLVYELTTPITVNLGSLSVPSLLGQNNLWQDAGNIDILKPMDRQLYYGR